jgi:hypothetical protein
MVRQHKGTHQGRTEEINRWWASNGSTLALRRFPVSKSGDGGISLGSGVPAKQLKSQSVYLGLRNAAPTYVALAGWYNPPSRHPYIGDVCLMAKVGLEMQRISREPEFTDWESKIDARSSSGPRFRHQNVRKMPHTTHKGDS